MIEYRMAEQVDHAAGCAGARVVGAKHHACDACLHYRAGTHRAGLKGYIERGARHTVISEPAGGGANRDNFGMGGRVSAANWTIPAFAHYLIVARDEGADRHLAGTFCTPRKRERELHEVLIACQQGVDVGGWVS